MTTKRGREFLPEFKGVVSVPLFIVAFLVLFLYEVLNFFLSHYQANSILFLRDFVLVLSCIFTVCYLLRNKKIGVISSFSSVY